MIYDTFKKWPARFLLFDGIAQMVIKDNGEKR